MRVPWQEILLALTGMLFLFITYLAWLPLLKIIVTYWQGGSADGH